MLDRPDVGRDIVVITGRSIDRDDLGHCRQMPLADIQVPNQLIPVEETRLPRTIGAIAPLTAIASRTPDVAQAAIDRTPSGGTEARLVHEERQGIGRVNGVASATVIECLPQASSRRVIGRKHAIEKAG